MKNFKEWFLATRPKTLSASLVPILASVGLVRSMTNQMQWWIVLFAVLSSVCIQIGTNLVNDAMDFRKGADTENRIGPKRVTQSGIFSFRQVLIAAGIFFVFATLFGIPLVLKGGLPIVIIGILSIIMGYAYTAGPFPLAYLGLGELFVILFFGLVAVGGMYYLLTGTYSVAALILGIQIGFLSSVLIAINNLRDLETDKLVNKKTLAVRFGVKGSRWWLAFLIFAPYFTGYYWLYHKLWWVYIIPLICFPLGLSITKRIFRTEPSAEYNKFLAQSAAYSLLFSLLLAVGFQLK